MNDQELVEDYANAGRLNELPPRTYVLHDTIVLSQQFQRRLTMPMPSLPASKPNATAAGAAGGALIGAVTGGPVGLVIGAGLGALGGVLFGQSADKDTSKKVGE